MLPPRGMDGTGSSRTGRGCRCYGGALDSSVPGRDSALDKCSVLPGPMSVSRVEDTVTEMPGTSGRCASEGCTGRAASAGAVRGPPGQLEGPCSSVSWRRARGALWLPGPPFGRVLPRSGLRRVVLRRDHSPRAGAAAARDRPVPGRVGYGQGAAAGASVPGHCRSTAGSRAWPGK